MSRCVVEARSQFRRNASERDPARIRKLVADAHEAADFLRGSVVQATLNEGSGRYEMRVKSDMAEPTTGKVDLMDAKRAAADGEQTVKGTAGGCGVGCGCSGAPSSPSSSSAGAAAPTLA